MCLGGIKSSFAVSTHKHPWNYCIVICSCSVVTGIFSLEEPNLVGTGLHTQGTQLHTMRNLLLEL